MDTININGTEYVPADSLKLGNHVCVICTNGWIFEGYIDKEASTDTMRLRKSHVVRKWSNGRGIGGLAKAEYKDEYTLDEVGSMAINPPAIISVIYLEW